AELTNTDSVSFGTIVAQKKLTLVEGEKVFLATALAPLIPDDGQFFVPEAFSPVASDAINQQFRIFGEGISDEGFSLQIYNQIGVIVYETSSFVEANEVGWDGRNQRNGVEETAGVYYYSLRLTFENEMEGAIEETGAFYLVR
ncbi:MAG: gliding motility-associated C-terminal domain-containing protein, partial [Bacteroidota bacterium]